MPATKPRPIAVCILASSYMAYAISFCLPVGNDGDYNGFTAFLSGLAACWCVPVWLANPAFWYASWEHYRGRNRRALLAAMVALLFAASIHVFLPEGSMYGIRLEIGYFVWLSAPAILSLGAAVELMGASLRQPHRAVIAQPSELPAGQA